MLRAAVCHAGLETGGLGLVWSRCCPCRSSDVTQNNWRPSSLVVQRRRGRTRQCGSTQFMIKDYEGPLRPSTTSTLEAVPACTMQVHEVYRAPIPVSVLMRVTSFCPCTMIPFGIYNKLTKMGDEPKTPVFPPVRRPQRTPSLPISRGWVMHILPSRSLAPETAVLKIPVWMSRREGTSARSFS